VKIQQRIAFGFALSVLAVAAGAQTAERKGYVVQLADLPVASYDGRVANYKATRPAPGAKLNINAGDVQNYLRYLDAKQSQTAATVPAAHVYYRFGTAFNGFAAKLTAAEVQKLAANPNVVAITPDERRKLNTSNTPNFLGLSGPGGAWSRTDANGRPIKGENVIIAHVDSGVWPENPSFSDKVDANGKPVPYYSPGTVVYDPLPAGRYKGICQAGEGFTANMCNNKLVGARYFRAAWDASGVATHPTEYRSPRDQNGHGTHTLGTSGGNEGVSGTVVGSLITGISGVAPRARVAAYKVCYSAVNPDDDGCQNADSVAAIDQAVADGVDVINYSISGSQFSYLDPVEVAFFYAAAAGVFVSTSAGNAGPGNNVAHLSPWVTTVGNSSHDRYTEAVVTLGNAYSAPGPSFQTGGLASKQLILATDAGVMPFNLLSNADKVALARCYNAADRATLPFGNPAVLAGNNAALDPAKVAGKIVVCYRGGNVLVNKTQEAKDKGAAGVIIQNLPAGLLPAPLNAATNNSTLYIAHVVPTVHLAAAHASQVIQHAGAGGTASFSGGVQVAGVIAPVMSVDSSRGPNKGDPDVLKPDVTAPGSEIIAAYAPTLTTAQRDAIVAGTQMAQPHHHMISGTSMAAPHVAGTAALLKQAHPTWSPAAIKSAVMTSASSTVKLADGTPDKDVWGYGAGHLNPGGALATSLVYDATPADFFAYATGGINPWSLNLASITRANVVGVGSVTRTLKNHGANSVTYNASASLDGFNVNVSPATLTLAPGASASYTTTLTRTTAAIGAWSFGSVVWTGDGGKTVRSPLQARASAFVGSSLVTDTRAVGSKVFTVATGWEGTMVTTPVGLVPATRTTRTAVEDQDDVCVPLAVPAGALQLRVQLFNSDTQGGTLPVPTDLDLYVNRLTVENGQIVRTVVGGSGAVDSEELVTLHSPAAGNYEACVVAYDPAPHDQDPTTPDSAVFTLSHWVVGPAVGPQTLKAFGASRVYLGGTATVGASWNVPVGPRYLGVIQYRQTAGGAPVGSTTVLIDTSGAGTPAVARAPVLRIKTPK
jgi:subtilisin family serine protease